MPVAVTARSLATNAYWRTLNDGQRRTGALLENFSRKGTSIGNVAALTLATALATSIELPAGLLVSSTTWFSGTQALVQGTTPHLWAVLCDSSRVVKAVTADDTNPVWGASAEHLFTFGAAFTTTYSGLYYLMIMNANSGGGGTAPSLMCSTPQVAAITGTAPITVGTSSTGQSVPPSLAATMTALSAVAADPWCYVS